MQRISISLAIRDFLLRPGEIGKAIAQNLYFSTFYSVVLIITVLLNILGIIWTIIAPRTITMTIGFMILEAVIILELICEILLKVFVFRLDFFKSLFNWFDLVVLVVSVGAIFVFELGPSFFEELDEILSLGLRIGRDLFLLVRLGRILKEGYQRRNRGGRIDLDISMDLDSPMLPIGDIDMSSDLTDKEIDQLPAPPEELDDKEVLDDQEVDEPV